MITCPNCGAGNKPGSSACRMCATSLTGIAEAKAPPTPPQGQSSHQASKPDSHHLEGSKEPAEQEGIVCSECNTLNEAGWSFCQQCGRRLTKPVPPPQPVSPGVPADLRTVPEQRAVVDPSLAEALKTNPEPQPAEHGLKTVVARPPSVELPPSNAADDRKMVEPKTTPKHPLPAAPTTAVVHPPAEDFKNESDSSTVPTVPVEPPTPPKAAHASPKPPVQEKPAAKQPPPAPKPVTQPPPAAPPLSAREPLAEQAGSLSGALCTQCGQSNTVGSAFCASCGAPMTFGKTMVISSQPAPPKGRLHLVMEGGQPGEVYELTDETVIGRTSGEITFPHDGFMSGRHARIEQRGDRFILTDEGSRNGTFIKLKEEVELKPGDMILVGKQLFRFEV